MSEYVDIRTSVADILSAANRVISAGAGLDHDMNWHVEMINGLEGTETWGGDKYGRKFLKNDEGGGYQQPVKVGDASMPANDAVKSMGTGKDSLGDVAQTLGGFVNNAMLNYSGTDDDNATAIGSLEEL
jgi:hypothetical protein